MSEDSPNCKWLDQKRATDRLENSDEFSSQENSRNEKYRSNFDRDYGRIIHCSSFRRLQGKTQVWGEEEVDFFRNRLTHSLEVAQIGFGISQILNSLEGKEVIEPSLIQACCLSHDIGHPPLGHDGEEVLNDHARKVMGYKNNDPGELCFDGNAQNLHILSKTENAYFYYPDGIGLNLCSATLDGIIKYKEEADGTRNEKGKIKKSGYYSEDKDIFQNIVKATGTNLIRSPLSMIVEIADDIAYCCHDLQDGMRSGFITQRILHNWLEEDCIEPMENHFDATEVKNLKHQLDLIYFEYDHNKIKRHKSIIELRKKPFRRFQKVFLSKMIHLLIEKVTSVLEDNKHRRTLLNHEYGKNTKNFFEQNSPPLACWLKCLKKLTEHRVYKTPNMKWKKSTGKILLKDYLERFDNIIKNKNCFDRDIMFQSLPPSIQDSLEDAENKEEAKKKKLRIILDYVSGMTDNFFLSQAKAFYDPQNVKAITYPK